ncbi:MAG: GNAT family N-acetyltransferase [Simkaniaceae bacterium]|nr:MAG: GNAT family N-acetyltransferase [Simkaniaceae bacterium]
MKNEISIRDYQPEDVQALAHIYYNTIHRINIQHYTEEQVTAWAPTSSLETEGWAKKLPKTKPIVASVGNEIVGFAEFEPNGHIDCFYCHHEWIGKGVGPALMKEILQRAKNSHIPLIFAEVSITAKPFFEKWGFQIVTEQTIVRKGVEKRRHYRIFNSNKSWTNLVFKKRCLRARFQRKAACYNRSPKNRRLSFAP